MQHNILAMEKVVIIGRVSTDHQNYERQVIELTDYCNKVGWEVVFRVYLGTVWGDVMLR